MKAEYGISLQVTDGQWKKASLTLEESDRLNGETPEEFLTRTASTLEGWFKSRSETPPPGAPAGELPVINRADERRQWLIEDATTVPELLNVDMFGASATTIVLFQKRLEKLKKDNGFQ